MAIKVLSGVLVTRGHDKGRATIQLSNHELIRTNDAGEERTTQDVWLSHETALGSGDYKAKPCRSVSLREFNLEVRITVAERRSRFDWVDKAKLEITDTINRDYLVINWSGDQIEEISYLVIGETD